MMVLGLYLLALAGISNALYCYSHIAAGQGMETYALPGVMTAHQALNVSYQEVFLYQCIKLVVIIGILVNAAYQHKKMEDTEDSFLNKYSDGRPLYLHKLKPRSRWQILISRKRREERGRHTRAYFHKRKADYLHIMLFGFCLMAITLYLTSGSIAKASSLFFHGVEEEMVITSIIKRHDKKNRKSLGYSVRSESVQTSVKYEKTPTVGDYLIVRYLKDDPSVAYVKGSKLNNPNMSASLGITSLLFGSFTLILGAIKITKLYLQNL